MLVVEFRMNINLTVSQIIGRSETIIIVVIVAHRHDLHLCIYTRMH